MYLIVFAMLIPAAADAALPDAAQPGRSVYVSLYGFPGAGLSLDAKLWRSLGLGTSFTGGRPGLYPGHRGEDPDGENLVFEAYGSVEVSRSSKPVGPGTYGVSLVGGIWFSQSISRPLAGLCCAYWADDRFVIRANAVYGPSSGIEIGYLFMTNLEATLTVLSGRGILGLRFGLIEPRRFEPDVDDLAGGI